MSQLICTDLSDYGIGSPKGSKGSILAPLTNMMQLLFIKTPRIIISLCTECGAITRIFVLFGTLDHIKGTLDHIKETFYMEPSSEHGTFL